MKTKLLKSMRMLLVAVLLGVGANAWGDVETSIYRNDYQLAETTDWKGQNVTPDLQTVDGNKFTRTYAATTGNRTSYLSFGNSSALSTGQTYVIEFKFQTPSNTTGSNTAYYAQYTQVYTSTKSVSTKSPTGEGSGLNNYLSKENCIVTFQNLTSNGSAFTILAGGTNTILNTLDNNAATWSYTSLAWYTVRIEGDGSGVSLTIKNADGTTVFSGSQTFADTDKIGYPTGILYTSRRSLNSDTNYGGFDDISLSYYTDLTSYLARMATAKSIATSFSSSVMNTDVRTALNNALASEYVDYEEASITSSNLAAYMSAIGVLETAVSNAQTSINNFTVLNDLISRAPSVTGYSAPEGASSTITVDSSHDPEVLAASVRAAIITAGTANENTDITALIANNSFELGNTLGWTSVASDDTGARWVGESGDTYYTSGADGNYLFNTWSKGTPITQTLGTLPAGQYTLTAKVSSNGATVYLMVNDEHEGTLTSDGAAFTEATYTFTLGSATEVTIGAVGGAGDGSFTAEGHWWYKADKFTLTYNGEDPLEQAKAALNDEIDAATTVKNSWTPKVGTAPFKYASTYYDVLVTELSEAATVAAGGSTTVSDYTTAKDELEAAKDNMTSSVQNTPDPNKYYCIYIANNGTQSNYNINLTKASVEQASVSVIPYPVKIVDSGREGRYRIQDPYEQYLCTNGNATNAYKNNYPGVSARCQDIRFILNENGTVTLSGYRGGGSADQIYSASANEGSLITGSTTNTGTWVISDAVDVTDVTLSVNATAGWGSFIAPYDNLTPSTVKAYTVSYTANNVVFFTENETGVLSANTPYILSTEGAENVSTTFKGIANNDENTYNVNGLVGLLTASTVPANSYILQYNDGQIGFYKTTSDITGTANRCYLNLTSVPTSAPSSSRATVSFGIFDGEATGIRTIDNGQLIIDNAVYNLKGQRVANPAKGLYIVKGKKVLVNDK